MRTKTEGNIIGYTYTHTSWDFAPTPILLLPNPHPIDCREVKRKQCAEPTFVLKVCTYVQYLDDGSTSKWSICGFSHSVLPEVDKKINFLLVCIPFP